MAVGHPVHDWNFPAMFDDTGDVPALKESDGDDPAI